MKLCRVLALAAAGLLFAGDGFGWQHDVTLQGIAFAKVKTEANGLLIGRIAADTVVHDRPCQRGWLHLHPNGVPSAFTAAREITLARVTIPVGTWVRQNPDGVVTICAFPQDTEVQGHWCRGSGGSKGVQVAFYPDGALKQFFPPRPTTIDGVPCATGLVHGSIELHGNGRLKSCRLADDLVRDGRKLRKGTRIQLTPDGQIES
jgi:hypothetical protein